MVVNSLLKTYKRFVSSKGINWSFNTAAAPWTGGFFERMIRCVKRCLRNVLLNTRITYNKMLTLLKEVENVLNNRPLTYVYSELCEEPLTLNMLLFGRNLQLTAKITDLDSINDVTDACVQSKNVKTLIEHFWRRWCNEYLT